MTTVSNVDFYHSHTVPRLFLTLFQLAANVFRLLLIFANSLDPDYESTPFVTLTEFLTEVFENI